MFSVFAFNSVSGCAAVLCLLLAAIRLWRGPRSIAGGTFSAGMLAFAVEACFQGAAAVAPDARSAARWETYAFGMQALEPAIWLCFSLSFSRGNVPERLAKWRLAVGSAALLPLALFVLSFPPSLFRATSWIVSPGAAWLTILRTAKAFEIILLIISVCILMNLEQTFRATVGALRWRIKFVVLGIALIFGAQVYLHTQAILFSAQQGGFPTIRLAALLLGSALVALAYVRAGFAEIEVYPSQAALRTSLTIVLVGAYLLIVGVLAQAISYFGGAETFEARALLILLAVTLLSALLLSDRLRQRVGSFVSRHFKKARHDSLQVWVRTSREMATVKDPVVYGATIARLISETFQALSVSIWLVNESERRLALAASTADDATTNGGAHAELDLAVLVEALGAQARPFLLGEVTKDWARILGESSPSSEAGRKSLLCVPFFAGEKLLGCAVLADRVNGVPYSSEEIELLKCLAEQSGAGLLNLRLTGELIQARELEAFQTMSAFFVHDLKNAASTLSLMLRNLPIHFDNPAFRQDALRGIGSTAARINQMVERLSVFKGELCLSRSMVDLNQLIQETLAGLRRLSAQSLTENLRALPPILADRDQIQSLVTNLVLNAQEAMPTEGLIQVETMHRNGRVCLLVSDTGCGMSPTFIQDSLFRAFQSTKKKGLGIGMFHAKMIVAAHGGTLQVESELGKGTTFQISLPVSPDL